MVFARQSLTGAQQDQAAVSLQGEQGGLLRVEDPGPHGDDLTGGLVRPGPDPRHAACKCFMLSRIISRLYSEVDRSNYVGYKVIKEHPT